MISPVASKTSEEFRDVKVANRKGMKRKGDSFHPSCFSLSHFLFPGQNQPQQNMAFRMVNHQLQA